MEERRGFMAEDEVKKVPVEEVGEVFSDLVKLRQFYELLRDRFVFMENLVARLGRDVEAVNGRVSVHEERLMRIDEFKRTEVIRWIKERLGSSLGGDDLT